MICSDLSILFLNFWERGCISAKWLKARVAVMIEGSSKPVKSLDRLDVPGDIAIQIDVDEAMSPSPSSETYEAKSAAKAAVLRLVERFDIEPFPDFSAK